MKLNKRKMFLIIITMFAIAMFDNVKGVFLPSFVSHYNTDLKIIGWLMLCNSFAYMTGSFVAGYTVEALGRAKMMQIASLCASAGLLFIVFFNHIAWLFLGFITIGFSNALAAFVINTTIPQLKVKHSAWLMNFVHFLYAFGAMITVKGAGILLGNGWKFKNIYFIFLGVYVVLYLVSLTVSLPENDIVEDIKVKFTKRQTELIFYYSIALGLYIVAEMQIAIWFVSYIMSSFKLDENSAATFMTLFFLVFAFGRLVGGLVAHKLGYLKSVIYSMACATVLLVMGMFTGLKGAYLIALSGLFFSICYPTAVLSFKNYFLGQVNKASGVIFTLSSGINMIFNVFMGYIAAIYSVRAAMFIIPASLTVGMLIFIYIKKKYTSVKA